MTWPDCINTAQNKPVRELSLDSVCVLTPGLPVTVASLELQEKVVSDSFTCQLGYCWTCRLQLIFTTLTVNLYWPAPARDAPF